MEMLDQLFHTLKYERVEGGESESGSDSSSSSYIDEIELTKLKVEKKKTRPKRNIVFEDGEDYFIPSEDQVPFFRRCRLNLILTIVLLSALCLIALEFRLLSGPKNPSKAHKPKKHKEDSYLTANNFNDFETWPDWKLNTEKAYKLDKDFSKTYSEPQERNFKFQISQVEAAPDGVWKNLTVINGKFPGPLIECNSGDTLVIDVENVGNEPTTLHFHGIYQNGTNYYDGSSGINQCDIPANGGKLTYKIKIDETQWGTYWYHSHYSTQYADGLFGPLIIHSSEEDRLMAKAGQVYDEDRVVIFNDWYHKPASSYMAQYLSPDNENTEPTPDSGLIQGSGIFDCSKTELACDANYGGRHVYQLRPDFKYRLRLINAGFFAEINFSIDEHMMKVVEVEGSNVKDLELDVLRIAVAQRYSVIFETGQVEHELLNLRATFNPFCFAEQNPNLDLDLKAIVAVSNGSPFPAVVPISNMLEANSTSFGHPNVRCRELNETLLSPLHEEVIPETEGFYQIDSSFQIHAHRISLGYMNDVHYIPLESSHQNSLLEQYNSQDTYASEGSSTSLVSNFNGDQLALIATKVATIDILINNYDDGTHPFHLHGYKFWVLAWGQGYFKPQRDYGSVNTVNPIKRDTVNVSGYGWVLLRIVLDNPGVWPFHCHLGWHMEAGLAMQVNVLPDVYGAWDLPQDWLSLCQD